MPSLSPARISFITSSTYRDLAKAENYRLTNLTVFDHGTYQIPSPAAQPPSLLCFAALDIITPYHTRSLSPARIKPG